MSTVNYGQNMYYAYSQGAQQVPPSHQQPVSQVPQSYPPQSSQPNQFPSGPSYQPQQQVNQQSSLQSAVPQAIHPQYSQHVQSQQQPQQQLSQQPQLASQPSQYPYQGSAYGSYSYASPPAGMSPASGLPTPAPMHAGSQMTHIPPPPSHTPAPPHAPGYPPPAHHTAGHPPMRPPLSQMGPVPYGGTQKRDLDPETMPSVVQVTEEDFRKTQNEQSPFMTKIPLSVPPLVSTLKNLDKFVMSDGGCARPNHFRSTLYQVPISEDILKSSNLPFATVIIPFAQEEIDGEMEVPVSNSEIVRCNRCKAYMSPFMRFVDGGSRFQCALCRHISEVPRTYAGHLDHEGRRLDAMERPELSLGSYELRGTAEYCRNSIQNCRRPHIIFAFEMTVNSKLLVQQLSKHLIDLIKNHLPTDPLNPGTPPPLVGFITYNSKIQFYDIKNCRQTKIISDVADTFAASTTFLVDPLTHADQIEGFLHSLPSLCQDNDLETETILGPVIDAALKSCQVDKSNWLEGVEQSANLDPKKVVPSGKVYIFHCTLPTSGRDGETPGRLKPRFNPSDPDSGRRLLGTDKEKNILTPAPSNYYSTLAQNSVSEYGSGVELFLFPPVNGSYLDIASISELTRLTGSGGIYKYFNDYSDRFITDLKLSLKSSFAFDSIIKVRTSTGIRPFEYFGNYYSRSVSDIECAVVNAESSVTVEIKYDDKLPEDEFVIIQVAILYTSLSGERRIRIHNAALSVCDKVAEAYKSCCCDTIMNFFLRSTISQLRSGNKTPQQVKDNLIARCVAILCSYRRHCAGPDSSIGQLIIPEALKLLPMYTIGALKCDAIDGGFELTPDEKAYAQIRALGASVDFSQVILYPRLLRIQYDPNDENSLAAIPVRCAAMRLDHESALAFILENGFHFFLYLPSSSSNPKKQQFLRNIFGVDSLQQIQIEMDLPNLLTVESQSLRGMMGQISIRRRQAIKWHIIRQGLDKLEIVFKSFLYEDRKARGSSDGSADPPSYVDFLCHIHKEIRTQLSN